MGLQRHPFHDLHLKGKPYPFGLGSIVLQKPVIVSSAISETPSMGIKNTTGNNNGINIFRS